MRTLTIAIVLLAAIAGCKDKASSAPPQAQASAQEPAPGSAAPPITGSDDMAPGTNVTQIFAQLDKEKQNRPGIEPTADTIVTAMEAAGVQFNEKQQVLGMTIGAAYCFRAANQTTGLNVVLCEYPTPEAAAKGADLSTTKFGKPLTNKTRTVTVKGATLIQVFDKPDQPLTEVRREIDAALAKL